VITRTNDGRVLVHGTGEHRVYGGQADWLQVELRYEPGRSEWGNWVVWPVLANPRFAEDDPQRRAEHAASGEDHYAVAVDRAYTLEVALERALIAVGLGEEGMFS
jgi:hypothetical protein